MAVELITGSPGAGKTCYAVSQRVVSEIGRQIVAEDEHGQPVTVTRRVVIAGVRGLKVAHERLPHTLTGEKVSASEIERENALDAEGEPVHKRLPGQPPHDVPASIFNWWRWCQPGDLIVCDEVQYIVPRGTLNKRAPFFIQALEIHRHYGVDFLFITQHPDFLDPHIRKLVGLHRHVRSVMGSSLCTVYTWDHASNPERFSLANKSVWMRRAQHFALYKSSVAHVKPPSSGRSILYVLPVAVVLCAVLFWKFKQRFTPAPVVPAAVAHVPGVPSRAGSAPGIVLVKSATMVEGSLHLPKLTGCYASASWCECLGESGRVVPGVPDYQCRKAASGFDGLVRWEPRKSLPPASPASAPARSSPVAALASALPASPEL